MSDSPAANPNSAPSVPGDNGTDPFTNGTTTGAKDKGLNSAEDIARIVWNYVKATESMIKELNEDDDARLLRVRTKRNELVIVPGMAPSIGRAVQCVHKLTNCRPEIRCRGHPRHAACLKQYQEQLVYLTHPY